ncbi:hypothetical protein ACISU4_11990 [Streptomyces wuyuanensis]|uniref:hypothetical protein n=1 Tax=Streptomyces wuyuanensis TaxID=1196353 RepID=UPI0037F8E2E4
MRRFKREVEIPRPLFVALTGTLLACGAVVCSIAAYKATALTPTVLSSATAALAILALAVTTYTGAAMNQWALPQMEPPSKKRRRRASPDSPTE